MGRAGSAAISLSAALMLIPKRPGLGRPRCRSIALKISVIIACHNEERTLAETLEAVAAQEWDQPWEVLFADNGSTDGSRAIFAARRRRRGQPGG